MPFPFLALAKTFLMSAAKQSASSGDSASAQPQALPNPYKKDKQV